MDKIFGSFGYFAVIGELIPGSLLLFWIVFCYLGDFALLSGSLAEGLILVILMFFLAYPLGATISFVSNSIVWKNLGLIYDDRGSNAVSTFVRTWDLGAQYSLLKECAARARMFGALFGVCLICSVHLGTMAAGLLSDMGFDRLNLVFGSASCLALGLMYYRIARWWWRYWDSCQHAAIIGLSEAKPVLDV